MKPTGCPDFKVELPRTGGAVVSSADNPRRRALLGGLFGRIARP